jgi:hypothetical protein
MIKAIINGNLILGLDKRNIERLTSDNPILFDGKPFGFEGQIAIVYGDTLQDIADGLDIDLKGFSGYPHA